MGTVDAELADLMSRIASPETFEIRRSPAPSHKPETVHITGKDFCALSDVFLTTGGTTTGRYCELVAEGGGDWTFRGRTLANEHIICRAVCF